MFEKIKEMISNYVEVNPDEISTNSRFIEDIGLNSYDFMCMLGEIEEEFNISVDESEIINLHTKMDVLKEGSNREVTNADILRRLSNLEKYIYNEK